MTDENREQLKKLIQAMDKAKKGTPPSSDEYEVIRLKADQIPPEILDILRKKTVDKVSEKRPEVESSQNPIERIRKAIEEAESGNSGDMVSDENSDEDSEEVTAMNYAYQAFDELFSYDNVNTELALANLIMIYTMKQSALEASSGISPVELLLKGPGIMTEIIDLDYLTDLFHGKDTNPAGPISPRLRKSLELGKSIYGSLSSGRILSIQERIAAVSLALSLLLREAEANS